MNGNESNFTLLLLRRHVIFVCKKYLQTGCVTKINKGCMQNDVEHEWIFVSVLTLLIINKNVSKIIPNVNEWGIIK